LINTRKQISTEQMSALIKYLIIFEKTETGFSAYVPDLPGCIATGKTKNIVEKNILDAIKFHLEGLRELNLEIPLHRTDAETFVFAV
jgi:predicted RNase H-like HicB family nuclease